jgi:hypothetical protein
MHSRLLEAPKSEYHGSSPFARSRTGSCPIWAFEGRDQRSENLPFVDRLAMNQRQAAKQRLIVKHILSACGIPSANQTRPADSTYRHSFSPPCASRKRRTQHLCFLILQCGRPTSLFRPPSCSVQDLQRSCTNRERKLSSGTQ